MDLTRSNTVGAHDAVSKPILARTEKISQPPPASVRPRADQVQLSPRTELRSRVDQLLNTDPESFKAQAQGVAQSLRQRATESPGDAEHLREWASRIERASAPSDLQKDHHALAPPSTDPVWQKGRGDGAELALASVLAQIGDAMSHAREVAASQAAHSARVVTDAPQVPRVQGVERTHDTRRS